MLSFYKTGIPASSAKKNFLITNNPFLHPKTCTSSLMKSSLFSFIWNIVVVIVVSTIHTKFYFEYPTNVRFLTLTANCGGKPWIRRKSEWRRKKKWIETVNSMALKQWRDWHIKYEMVFGLCNNNNPNRKYRFRSPNKIYHSL